MWQERGGHQLNKLLLEEALTGKRAWSDQRRLRVFVTALLLLDEESPLHGAALRGLAKGKLGIDSRLVEDFYRNGRRQVKFAIAQSVVAYLLPAPRFARIFFDALRRRPSVRERGRLVQSLRFHLAWNPAVAERYRPLIRRLLRSAEGDDRLLALELVSRLDRIAPSDLALVAGQLKSKREGERINAVHALATWSRRPAVNAGVRHFSMADTIRATIRRMRASDPSADVRLAASHYPMSGRRKTQR